MIFEIPIAASTSSKFINLSYQLVDFDNLNYFKLSYEDYNEVKPELDSFLKKNITFSPDFFKSNLKSYLDYHCNYEYNLRYVFNSLFTFFKDNLSNNYARQYSNLLKIFKKYTSLDSLDDIILNFNSLNLFSVNKANTKFAIFTENKYYLNSNEVFSNVCSLSSFKDYNLVSESNLDLLLYFLDLSLNLNKLGYSLLFVPISDDTLYFSIYTENYFLDNTFSLSINPFSSFNYLKEKLNKIHKIINQDTYSVRNPNCANDLLLKKLPFRSSFLNRLDNKTRNEFFSSNTKDDIKKLGFIKNISLLKEFEKMFSTDKEKFYKRYITRQIDCLPQTQSEYLNILSTKIFHNRIKSVGEYISTYAVNNYVFLRSPLELVPFSKSFCEEMLVFQKSTSSMSNANRLLNSLKESNIKAYFSNFSKLTLNEKVDNIAERLLSIFNYNFFDFYKEIDNLGLPYSELELKTDNYVSNKHNYPSHFTNTSNLHSTVYRTFTALDSTINIGCNTNFQPIRNTLLPISNLENSFNDLKDQINFSKSNPCNVLSIIKYICNNTKFSMLRYVDNLALANKLDLILKPMAFCYYVFSKTENKIDIDNIKKTFIAYTRSHNHLSQCNEFSPIYLEYYLSKDMLTNLSKKYPKINSFDCYFMKDLSGISYYSAFRPNIVKMLSSRKLPEIKVNINKKLTNKFKTKNEF